MKHFLVKTTCLVLAALLIGGSAHAWDFSNEQTNIPKFPNLLSLKTSNDRHDYIQYGCFQSAATGKIAQCMVSISLISTPCDRGQKYNAVLVLNDIGNDVESAADDKFVDYQIQAQCDRILSGPQGPGSTFNIEFSGKEWRDFIAHAINPRYMGLSFGLPVGNEEGWENLAEEGVYWTHFEVRTGAYAFQQFREAVVQKP